MSERDETYAVLRLKGMTYSDAAKAAGYVHGRASQRGQMLLEFMRHLVEEPSLARAYAEELERKQAALARLRGEVSKLKLAVRAGEVVSRESLAQRLDDRHRLIDPFHAVDFDDVW